MQDRRRLVKRAIAGTPRADLELHLFHLRLLEAYHGPNSTVDTRFTSPCSTRGTSRTSSLPYSQALSRGYLHWPMIEAISADLSPRAPMNRTTLASKTATKSEQGRAQQQDTKRRWNHVAASSWTLAAASSAGFPMLASVPLHPAAPQ